MLKDDENKDDNKAPAQLRMIHDAGAGSHGAGAHGGGGASSARYYHQQDNHEEKEYGSYDNEDLLQLVLNITHQCILLFGYIHFIPTQLSWRRVVVVVSCFCFTG